jgi:hypothetical protein
VSFDNILGNLTATGIWTILAYFVYAVQNRFRRIRKNREQELKWAKQWSSLNAPYELRLELISFLQIRKDQIQLFMYSVFLLLLFEAIFLIFIMLHFDFVFSLKITEWRFSVFICFAFIILLAYTLFTTKQYINFLNEFEDAFSDGITTRIEHLTRIGVID